MTLQLVPDSIKKPSGLKKDGTPNLYWKRFKDRTAQFRDLPVEEWSFDQVLGHMFNRYSEHYQIDFAFSYSGPPTKSPEMYCIRRISETLGTANTAILKEFIDWVFDTHIIPKNKEIISLAYFWNKGLCNQFRATFRNRHKLTKSTPIPIEFKEVADRFGLNVSTYGDLAFAKMALDSSPTDYPEYVEFFKYINQLGFNKALLDKLEV